MPRPGQEDELLRRVRELLQRLIRTYPFYGGLAGRIKEIRRDRSSSPASTWGLKVKAREGRGDKGEESELSVGAEFNAFTEEEQLSILHHELLHLALEHLQRGTGRDRLRWWLASDLACNQLIPSLPEGALTLEALDIPLPPRPGGYTAEAIYGILSNLTDQQLLQALLGAGGGIQSYPLLFYRGRANLGTIRGRFNLRDMRQAAASSTGGGGIGSHPSSRRREAGRAQGEEGEGRPLPWPKILIPFLPKASSPLKEGTRKRPNRRYGYLSPGSRRTHKLKLAVALDTSGSIGERALSLFARELERLSGLSILELLGVIICDARVHGIYHRSRSRWTREPELELRGGGGTDFRPAFRKAEELAPDLLIYFTDGLGTYPARPKFPVIWALDGTKPQSKIGVDWGLVVKLRP